VSTATALRAPRLARASTFLRHLFEMTLAMMLGMLAYGLLGGTLLAAAGSSLEDARLGQPELFVLGMAFSMSVTMVAWMRRRGHSWRSGLEMSAAMFVPAVLLIICYRLHAVSVNSICPLACAAMIPAMAAAMLIRRGGYTDHRHQRRLGL
jgi:flagellar biosynthetic protein FliP